VDPGVRGSQADWSNVDLDDPDTFLDGAPHEAFAWLRDNDPVHFQPQREGLGYWCITKYADIVKASKDFHHFSSEPNTFDTKDPPDPGIDLMMINMDPPRHTKLRQIVSKGFHPRIIANLETGVRRIVNEILDRVGPKGECDFVTDIAAELPMEVIAELAAVPGEDRQKIFDWTNTMIARGEDPEYSPTQEHAMNAFLEIQEYASGLVQERRERPGDDLLSAIVQGEVDGEHLTEFEHAIFFVMMMVAGNETTRNLVSGGMLALIQHPGERRRIRDDPSLFPTAVEEMLRWVTPVHHFIRTIREDMEVSGRRIRTGEKVALWYSSANRDDEVFAEPYRFDAGRQPNPHVTFGGGGPHFCLGFSLAQLEIKILFEEVLRRLPDMEPAGPVERLRSNFINGIRHMPVRFTPEPA
jgi:cholest-4-en-3-one 26-monooxygenase